MHPNPTSNTHTLQPLKDTDVASILDEDEASAPPLRTDHANVLPPSIGDVNTTNIQPPSTNNTKPNSKRITSYFSRAPLPPANATASLPTSKLPTSHVPMNARIPISVSGGDPSPTSDLTEGKQCKIKCIPNNLPPCDKMLTIPFLPQHGIHPYNVGQSNVG